MAHLFIRNVVNVELVVSAVEMSSMASGSPPPALISFKLISSIRSVQFDGFDDIDKEVNCKKRNFLEGGVKCVQHIILQLRNALIDGKHSKKIVKGSDSLNGTLIFMHES